MKQLTRRIICHKCVEFFDVPSADALPNFYGAPIGVCPACSQVDKWMEASSDSA